VSIYAGTRVIRVHSIIFVMRPGTFLLRMVRICGCIGWVTPGGRNLTRNLTRNLKVFRRKLLSLVMYAIVHLCKCVHGVAVNNCINHSF
jgi:hypothetical protein